MKSELHRRPRISRAGITRRDVLAMLAAFGVSDAALAAAPNSVLASDPVVMAPKSYRVVFENDMVRVLEYNNRPVSDHADGDATITQDTWTFFSANSADR
jgi:hypothetical protein